MSEQDSQIPKPEPQPANVDSESQSIARHMVDGQEGTVPTNVRARLFEQSLQVIALNYGQIDHSYGPNVPGFSFIPGREEQDSAIEFVKMELRDTPVLGGPFPQKASYYPGRIDTNGATVSERPSATDFYYRLSKPDGFKEMSVRTVMEDLLAGASTDETKSLALSAVRFRDHFNDKSIPGYYRGVVRAFVDASPEQFTAFLETVAELDDLSDPESKDDAKMATRGLNMVGRIMFRQEQNAELAVETLEALDDHGLLIPRLQSGVDMMANPRLAKILARATQDEDIFAELAPHARRNAAYLLLQKILEQQTDEDSGYNRQNAKVIKDTLFKPGSYKNVVPIRDLLNFANSITTRANQNRPDGVKRELLPVGSSGAADFVNAGEAVFRILSLTATKKEQLEEARTYAELIDALFALDYKKFEASRIVTVADIAARYPDAKQDIVLELQTIAQEQGYAAATRQYADATGRGKRRLRYNRHSPGYGIMS